MARPRPTKGCLLGAGRLESQRRAAAQGHFFALSVEPGSFAAGTPSISSVSSSIIDRAKEEYAPSRLLVPTIKRYVANGFSPSPGLR